MTVSEKACFTDRPTDAQTMTTVLLDAAELIIFNFFIIQLLYIKSLHYYDSYTYKF